MAQYRVCNCPKCNNLGVSVAALKSAETQVWSKEGKFSGTGVGVGIGTGGLGVGVGIGGGKYSEEGQSSTQRARQLSMPYQHQSSGITRALSVVIIFCSFGFLSNFVDFSQISQFLPKQLVPQTELPLIDIMKIVGMVFVVFIGIALMLHIKNGYERDNDFYAERHAVSLKRYHELRFCEHCNCIYDHNNHAEDANEVGMHKMMQIQPTV